MTDKKKLSTSEFLDHVIKAKTSNRISIDELKISLHERGFGILLIIFALPMSIPIPYVPGITTFFACPLVFLSLQMMLGFEFPWLPKWLSKQSIKRSTLRVILTKSSPILKKVEKLLKPRLLSFSSVSATKIIGFLSFLSALSIALPFPFTNFIPALSIVIMSLGLLSKDGITIAFGTILTIIGLVFTVAVLSFGVQLVIKIINSILN